ncbi:MAG: circadian clock protein KaiC [Candidatus Acidiferrum sp.]
MPSRARQPIPQLAALKKAPTGIAGLDEISEGGLPKGRTTILCGGPGCGKTMLGMEFLIRGAQQFNEPGVLMAFEESPVEIAQNVASLGFNLNQLAAENKLFLDFIRVEPSEIQESGSYDLEGLFIRLQNGVDTIGAKRVMFDTLEALFAGFSNMAVLRSEFRRLFAWLKERGLTTVITAERGEHTLTRYGLEEYVSDCVIVLDHRIKEQISSRRLRIVKYRGTKHGSDEYPFLIDERGVSILPITSLQLRHKASSERVASGVSDLDEMLGGRGYFRGSSVLVSGTAGSGKTTLGASFVAAACERGERSLYIDFEESSDQLIRNMVSVGIDLASYVTKELLFHEAWRPTQFGTEMHLLRIHKLIERVKPRCVVIDPITNLMKGDNRREAYSMLVRLMDFLKGAGITSLFLSLTNAGEDLENTALGVSSLADTWILLRDLELNGERNRCIYVLKSRGMAHSNQLREFTISDSGLKLLSPYVGSAGVLTGSSRLIQEAKDRMDALKEQYDTARRLQEMETRRITLQAQISSLQAEFRSIESEAEILSRNESELSNQGKIDRERLASSRKAKPYQHEKEVKREAQN